MDPFAVIILAGLAAFVIWIAVLGKFSGSGLEQLDWKSGREVTESREALEAEDRRRPYRLTTAGATALKAHLAAQARVTEVGLRRLAVNWSSPTLGTA